MSVGNVVKNPIELYLVCIAQIPVLVPPTYEGGVFLGSIIHLPLFSVKRIDHQFHPLLPFQSDMLDLKQQIIKTICSEETIQSQD